MNPNRNLKIAVIGSTYARRHDDPAVPWQRQSVNRLAARGHDVTVIAPSFKGLKSHSIDGVSVRRFRYAPASIEALTHDEGAPNKLKNPLFKLLAIPYIISGTIYTTWLAARKRFDVIHVHWPFPHGVMAFPAATLFGTSIVMTCHGAELALGRKSKWIRNTLGRWLRRADALACNSSHTRAEIQKISGRTATILPYGSTVPVRDTAPARRPADAPATLLFSGRLIQRKGVHYLLRALPLVLEKRPVKLFITGEGDRRAEWESLTAELRLQAHVEFLGFVSNERLGELYQTCDLYVHPAIYDDNGDTEGLGVVLIEALANARPVVASGVGGIVDVIQNEQTGLLVPEKDPGALAAAILRVLNNPALAKQLGQAGRAYAQRYFDWERVINETENLYYRLTSDKKPADVLEPVAVKS
jgi:glycosyltransferase involved in cell wall biosynthesis